MFGFVKKLLGRKEQGNEAAGVKPSAPPKPSAPAVSVSARTGAATGGPNAFAGQAAAPAKAAAGGGASSGTVQVSLLGIVSLLPSELKPARAVGDLAGVQLSFPERPILEQLAQGCVRVPFNEIRKLAPEGFFTAGHEHDQMLVELPLQELLPQLHSRSFGRRPAQKTTHVPDEVTSLFSARGNAITPGPRPSQNGQPPPSGGTSHVSRPATSVPGPNAGAKPSAPPAQPPSTQSGPAPQAAPAGAIKPKTPIVFNGGTPGAAQNSPAKPAQAAKPTPVPPAQTAAEPPSSDAAAADSPQAEPAPPVSKPIAAPSLMAAMKGSPSAAAAAQKPASATPSTPSNSSASAGTELVTFNLAQLSGGWPEAVRGEISQWKLDNASVGIPAEEIASALKLGRVKYTWAELLTRTQGAEGKHSSIPSVEVELPLPIVAPAFLSRPRNKAASSAPARGSTAQDIPDLFHAGKPAVAEAPGAPASRPAVEPPAAPKASVLPGTGLLHASQVRPAASPSHPQSVAATSVAPAASAPAAQATGQVMGVPLAMIDESWPDALKTEISRCQLPGIKLEMPIEELDRSLKLGKIEYTWRQLRNWVRPALPGEVGAEHADRLLTLPLKVIAPLFLSQLKGGQTRRKVGANSDIPDLFSGGPGNQPAPTAVGKPGETVPTPAAAQAAAAPAGKAVDISSSAGEISGSTTFSTTQFFRKPPADLGELFGQPGKRNWTPNDIVQNSCRIRGVSGAVIAMQDGLLVAAQVSSPWKSEATAAFLPQIYSRLNQYLKELGVGDMSSVTLNTENGTLFVFNAGIIYFAVISKPDESVPLAPIKLIVSELSRHTK